MHDAAPAGHPLSELDRPRTIQDLAGWLKAHGESVSAHTLWRWAREGRLPVARCGRRTTTAAAYFAAKMPVVTR